MEKTVPVRPEGVLRLPPGFRFHPTDEELVVQYLRRKVFCCPLPAAIIPEIQLSGFDPWDLPGGCSEGERYFFSAGEARHRKGSRRPCRSSAAGYWKAAGRDRRVVASGSDQVVGMKKTLVFYRGKAPGGSRTEWVMHEYRLAGDGVLPCVFPLRKNSSTHCSMARAEDWVLCRIFKKRRPARRGGGGGGGGEGGSTARRSPPSATLSASESSCVTEASDVCGDGEEDNSSCSSASSSSSSSSSPRVGEP